MKMADVRHNICRAKRRMSAHSRRHCSFLEPLRGGQEAGGEIAFATSRCLESGLMEDASRLMNSDAMIRKRGRQVGTSGVALGLYLSTEGCDCPGLISDRGRYRRRRCFRGISSYPLALAGKRCIFDVQCCLSGRGVLKFEVRC